MDDLCPGFEFTLSPEYDSPDVFVLNAAMTLDIEDDDVIKGGVLEGEDVGGDFRAGTLSGMYVPIVFDTVDLFDRADAHSSGLTGQAQALIKVFGDAGFGAAPSECCSAWLGLEMMKIDPRLRGRELSYQFLNHLINLVGDDTIITAQADAQGHPDRELTKEEVEVAKEKLHKHWCRFGFRPLGEDTDILYINTGRIPPPGTWRYENQGYSDAPEEDEPNEAADEFDEGLFEGPAHLMPDGEDFFNGDF
jgi:hypothetical protein